MKGLTYLNPTLTRRRQLWLTLLLGTVSATGPLAIDLYLPALPQMRTQFGTSASLMQLSITACLIGLALGQLIAGPLSDQYGRRRPLIAGFIIFGLVSLTMAFIQSITLLIILRFIQGLAGYLHITCRDWLDHCPGCRLRTQGIAASRPATDWRFPCLVDIDGPARGQTRLLASDSRNRAGLWCPLQLHLGLDIRLSNGIWHGTTNV